MPTKKPQGEKTTKDIISKNLSPEAKEIIRKAAENTISEIKRMHQLEKNIEDKLNSLDK